MDLTQSIEPKSDQLDAVDLLSGPRTFTVEGVSAHNSEQPVNVKFVEFPRVWRPSKSMRRVLVAAWGADGHAYAGRKLTLFCDPEVEFGGIKVGGTRISHMSHIDKPLGAPLAVALLVKRGKSVVFTVQPLTESAPTPTASPTGLATQRQKSALGAYIKSLGLDKDAYLTHATESAGRIIAATDELTETEADALVTVLAAIEGESNE